MLHDGVRDRVRDHDLRRGEEPSFVTGAIGHPSKPSILPPSSSSLSHGALDGLSLLRLLPHTRSASWTLVPPYPPFLGTTLGVVVPGAERAVLAFLSAPGAAAYLSYFYKDPIDIEHLFPLPPTDLGIRAALTHG